MAFTPDSKTAYVVDDYCDLAPGAVTPIATATNKAGPSVTVGVYPRAMAITP
jgi:DNA-binding beta-propeller fold protein YncE